MFLYSNYTNIFNKIIKDNLDLNLLNNFLTVLKKIEDGECDQHEASVIVGNILKELYVDSAIRKEQNREKRDKKRKKKDNKRKKKNISWLEYKKTL